MLWGAIPLVLVGLPADWWLFPDVWVRLNILRFGVALPLIIAALFLLRASWVRRHSNGFIAIWVATLCVAYFLPTMFTPLPGVLQSYVPSFWIFPLLTVFILGIRAGIGVGLLVTGCYFVTVLYHQLPTGIVILQSITILPIFGCLVVLRFLLEHQSRAAFLNQVQLSQEKERSEELLLNILPPPIASRLKENPGVIADRIETATVLFADLVGFTAMAAKTDPEVLVHRLNELFGAFDQLVKEHRLEKIKTIGDAYMVAGGIPDTNKEHVGAMVNLAFQMIRTAEEFSANHGENFTLRIGIHTGPLVAGVIGSHKFAYDLWGDTVNTASRMESNSEPGRLLVTQDVIDALNGRYPFEVRESMPIKGKGSMRTFLLSLPEGC